MPTARAMSSIGASCMPRSSNRRRVAETISRSRSRRTEARREAIGFLVSTVAISRYYN